MILHHVSEALIRLFLAHSGVPPCPWFEVGRLRNFREFKERAAALRQTRWPDGLRRDAAIVFLATDAKSMTEDRQETLAAIERFVRLLVTTLLDDSNLYNGVKHGMATLAGDTALGVTSDATGQGFGVQGARVTFLESSREGNIRKWSNTRRWVSIRKAMYLSQLAILEIDALWAIARARYVGAELAGVRALTKETVDSVIFGDMSDPSSITRFSHVVAIERLGPAAPTDA